MKKLYIFGISMVLAVCCNSQTILIDQVVFEAGDNISVVFDDTNVSEGSDGENVIWDFSNTFGTDTVTWIGVDPADHDIAQEYWTDADLGAFVPAPFNDSIDFRTFEFYDFGNGRISTLGSYSILKNKITNEADTQIVNYINDPFEEFEFPLSYLDEFESDYRGEVTGSIQGIEMETKRGGDVVMIADATGTIHTPTGTYDNVLRVKRIETRYDSSFFEFEGQTFVTVVETENVIFDWLQPERKYTLYRVSYGTITYPGIPPQTMPPVAFYTIENGVLNVDENGKVPELSFYPNPTNDALTIENFDALNVRSIEIYDVSGNRALRIAHPSENISLENLISGNYIIKVVSDRGVYSQKMVKI